MRAIITLVTLLAALAVVVIVTRERPSAGKRAKPMMSQVPIDKEQKVREIYDRAKEKIARLRKERRGIMERFVKKADQIRMEQAKKRLNDL